MENLQESVLSGQTEQSGSTLLTFNPELHMHHINFKEFALKPSLQNLHDGNKLKTKVSNHEIIRIPYQSVCSYFSRKLFITKITLEWFL